MSMPSHLSTILYTAFALIAFAGNSVLCRLALVDEGLDAGSFTLIRLLSGIIVLLILWYLTQGRRAQSDRQRSRGSWPAALMLFIYALGFSYAYISLDTGTGALILFGAVQITMVLVSLLRGTRLLGVEWFGLVLAFCGFVYLMLPVLNTPSLWGFIIMTLAGIAWGIYTLVGRGSVNPLSDTFHNFFKTLPLIIVTLIILLLLDDISLTVDGVLLAMVSGGIASGIGYAVWYRALRGLSAVQAAALQLLVPVIAALGGVIFANDMITLRLLIAALLVLGGIFLIVAGRYYLLQRRVE
ncbi:DMT family transporter [Amphritea sp. 1_MG-2023]|uniref:DMT family transporter n=1 Tax=Amphritea sp. 1_MG-2023 TaxID=3062670 RepID=UPI0026E42E17|nr:DMT family transporter [Amphritea sp. 1_MG-2023]MDO6564587.1 DMT family transporter [Amphritea sp. 1_MG-2023]